jgi:hypothetical protein
MKQVYEVEVLTKSGEPRSVMVSVSPLHGVEGEILGVLGNRPRYDGHEEAGATN